MRVPVDGREGSRCLTDAAGGRDPVGVDDDFLALGGNSLLATQITSRIHRAFGVALPLTARLDTPTPDGLAAAVAEAKAAGAPAEDSVPIAPLARDAHRRRLPDATSRPAGEARDAFRRTVP